MSATRRALGPGPGEEGFTIIEMMVALTVILMVMTSMAYLLATSLKQVSFAKQRQAASALLDKTMEQARALPYSVIATGLDDADVTNSHDSNITVNGSTFTFVPTGETIVHGNQNGTQTCPTATVCQAPLTPHQTTTTQNGAPYTVSTYLTNYNGNSSVYRITVILSWTPSVVQGVANQVSSQSVLYSPANGCLSDQTHPFAAPCQPFLYAQATSGKGAITIGPPTGATGDPIQGVALQQAVLQLGQIDSTMQIEQTSKVQGALETGGAILNVGGTPTSVGGASASSQADNDPATPSTTQPTCPTSQSVTAPGPSSFDPGGSGDGISLTASQSDAGCTVSTVAASSSSSPQCTDLGSSPLNTLLPCGSGYVQQLGGTPLAASLSLAAGGQSLGPASLASVAVPANATKVFAGRLASPLSTYCTTTTSDGCVHADAQRSIGTVTLAGLPASLGAAPTNWGTGSGNFLLQLLGYSDAVSAESGIGSSAPCTKQATTCAGIPSGTLKYWNGNGYTTTTINWGASSPTVSIPAVNVSTSVGGVAVTVSITNTLTFGGTSTATSGTTPCRTAECKATAQVTSPIQGNILYTVTVGGSTVTNLDVNVNLGTLAVQTNYKAAPLAG